MNSNVSLSNLLNAPSVQNLIEQMGLELISADIEITSVNNKYE